MSRHFNPAGQITFAEFIELSAQVIERQGDERSKSVEYQAPKITLSSITGKIRELRISKSLVAQLIHKGEPYPVCPYNVYHTFLLRDVAIPTSESMLKGLYFESRCIGSSAGGNITIDLPRHKKTGAKLSDHQRIDQAIELFFHVVKEYGLIIDRHYTQLYRKRRWIDPAFGNHVAIYLDGTLDFISPITTPKYSFDIATIDLKLTRDREACDFFTTGLYHPTPWGMPERMDFTEAMMYRLIFELPFVYLVFDYKKEDPGFKDIPIITNVNDHDPQKAKLASQRMDTLFQTLRWVRDTIFRWQALHWPVEPNTLVCSRCVIQDCSKRMEKVEV